MSNQMQISLGDVAKELRGQRIKSGTDGDRSRLEDVPGTQQPPSAIASWIPCDDIQGALPRLQPVQKIGSAIVRRRPIVTAGETKNAENHSDSRRFGCV